MKNYKLYCDGAYSSSRDAGGIGLVILDENDELVVSYSRKYENTTNIKMELLALITGLMSIKKPIDSLEIYTDSQYCIGCATQGWKITKNKEYWALYNKTVKNLKTLCPKISFNHIKGHNGDKWNEFVDKLAVEASKEL